MNVNVRVRDDKSLKSSSSDDVVIETSTYNSRTIHFRLAYWITLTSSSQKKKKG
jgi:hypothetical protein